MVARWMYGALPCGFDGTSSSDIISQSLVFDVLMYVSFHNCMRYNTPLYMLNKDNMEHVIQVKQGHVECLGSLFGKYDATFRGFPKMLD